MHMSEEKPVQTDASIEKAYAAYLLALAARRPDSAVPPPAPERTVRRNETPEGGIFSPRN